MFDNAYDYVTRFNLNNAAVTGTGFGVLLLHNPNAANPNLSAYGGSSTVSSPVSLTNQPSVEVVAGSTLNIAAVIAEFLTGCRRSQQTGGGLLR